MLHNGPPIESSVASLETNGSFSSLLKLLGSYRVISSTGSNYILPLHNNTNLIGEPPNQKVGKSGVGVLSVQS